MKIGIRHQHRFAITEEQEQEQKGKRFPFASQIQRVRKGARERAETGNAGRRGRMQARLRIHPVWNSLGSCNACWREDGGM